ncbi:MAG: molybdenum ABC transporter ATP-binding protein [Pseudomonadota bacterium]
MLDSPRLTLQLSMPVLDKQLDVDESIALAGNTTALFGPSGSGKSRLLRAIAGVDWKDAGRALGRITYGSQVLLDSEAGTYVPMHQRPVAYVPQAPALFPHMSVERNIAYAVKRAFPGGPSVDRLIELLDLGSLADAKPDTLSGGERQRVALARALGRGATLLLLDEPMAALDRGRKLEMMAALESVQSQLGISIILVSHAIEEVMRLASHTLVLASGDVLAHGPTVEVFDTINQSDAMGAFEAGSVLEAVVDRHNSAHWLTHMRVGDQTLAMPLLERLEEGTRVLLRIRSRDVAIALDKPTGLSIRNCLPVTITAITSPPDSAFAEVALRLEGAALSARITKAACKDLGLEVGQEVYALVKSVSFDRRMV